MESSMSATSVDPEPSEIAEIIVADEDREHTPERAGSRLSAAGSDRPVDGSSSTGLNARCAMMIQYMYGLLTGSIHNTLGNVRQETADNSETPLGEVGRERADNSDYTLNRQSATSTSTNAENIQRFQSTLSKLLFAASIALIIAAVSISATPRYHWAPKVTIYIEAAALFMMMAAFYLREKNPTAASWMHRIGHVLCVEGLIVLVAPRLELSPLSISILLPAISVILIVLFI